MAKTREIDEETLRDREIRRLKTAADMAYRMMNDERMGENRRHGWFKRYTDAVRALMHLLKERELKEIERRLDLIEEYRKNTPATNTRPSANDASSPPGGS